MRTAVTVLFVCLVPAVSARAENDQPAHERPFFMPAAARARVKQLIEGRDWARQEYERVKAAAEKGNGYWAAFLYALEGDDAYLPAVVKYLSGKIGDEGYWVTRYRKSLADPNYFKAGQTNISGVYYNIDVKPYVAYDWAYRGLTPEQRKEFAEGIETLGRFRMRAMDRWTQTPNLVFKPTFMVAMMGMAIQNEELLEWGFRRTKPWGSGRGGYFPVVNSMLRDGAVWHEAPIYPISHKVLWCMATMSFYRGLYDGKDWWNHEEPSGGSPAGLMEYYLDTAYPIERTGHGPGQVRVVTYGDGATGPGGDMFLANPAGSGGNMHQELMASYNVSGDPRLAPFLGMVEGYRPNLWDQRPLPEKTALPAAPSKIWPNYGLAMLRSDESAGYWNNPDAIAVFQIMSQGYGHDHRDKFAICLHGANRLLYPDYNAIQYENMTIGWTRNSPSHNTLIVDEQDTQNAEPTGIRHEFSPEVKFLATSASGVFEGVDQTRALLLTEEYLLDVFQASSEVPHDYDYMLHSFGEARPEEPGRFKPSDALVKRYWLVENQRVMKSDESWRLDFVLKDEPEEDGGKYGDEWYGHTARVRVTMAGEPGTLVGHGDWGAQLGEYVKQRSKGRRELDSLSALIVRRPGARHTLFTAVHEPYANEEKPQVDAVTVLDRTPQAVAVRIDGKGFTDYAVATFGPQEERPLHVLRAGEAVFALRNYGLVRVDGQGNVTARGDWEAFRVPGGKGKLVLNGRPAKSERAGKVLAFGEVPEDVPAVAERPPECPLEVAASNEQLRVWLRDRRQVTFRIKNTLEKPVSGRIAFETPEGIEVDASATAFEGLKPGESAELAAQVQVSDPEPGEHTIPYRVVYRTADSEEEIRTAALPLEMIVGPTLKLVYQHPKSAVYRVFTSHYTTDLRMFDGLCVRLVDDSGTVRLDGSPLFTLSDGEKTLLHKGTEHAFTWPKQAPASLMAHAQDRCRWQALFMPNRMLVRMNSEWTQFERTHFTIPGDWVSPGGKPRWRRVVVVDGKGQERDVRPGQGMKVAAAELEFPGGEYNLAFMFSPPQAVNFSGAGMEFSIDSLTKENWQVGFCEPGGLDAWRGKE